VNGNNPHINYSREDIRRYLQGGMSPAEMHALEKAAHEDAFLADAIEGYREADPQHADLDLAEVRAALLNEKKVDPVIPPVSANRWWRVAAILLVVISASVLGWYALRTKPAENNLSRTPVPKKDSTVLASQPHMSTTAPSPMPAPKDKRVISPARSNSRTSADIADVNAETDARRDRLATHDQAAQPAKPSPINSLVPGSNQGSITGLGTLSSLSVSGNIATGSFSNTWTASNQPVISRSDTLTNLQGSVNGITAMAKQTKPVDAKVFYGSTEQISRGAAATPGGTSRVDPRLRLYTGVVLDSNRVPIPSATLSFENLKAGTNTDQNGRFSFIAPDSLRNVTVNAVGFSSREVVLAANTPTPITLQPSHQALEEVVVTGYGSRKKPRGVRDEEKTDSIGPAGGWNAFRSYLASGLGIISNGERRLEAELSFNGKGKVTGASILRTWNNSLDPQIITLFKNGPVWLGAGGKAAKGKKKIALLL